MTQWIVIATTVVEASSQDEAEEIIATLYAGKHDVDIESSDDGTPRLSGFE